MRILYDSKIAQFKTPFGTLRTGENCLLRIWLPHSSGAVGAQLLLEDGNGKPVAEFPFTAAEREKDYRVYACSFSLKERGVYYYYFRILKETGSFRLFKQGNGTNMEAGDKWQLSVIPEDFTTPDFAKGAVMYQILPDRFHKMGDCDVTRKLRPFTLHENWLEPPRFGPDAEGNWCNDFFGGNLAGIREKLPYLQSLGVTVLYLNPIFMAFSNHRYDTADYKRIDPLLGTEEDFSALCRDAHTLGMRIILDGVFSHTGSNSVYFDAKGVFGGGAVSDPDSPYRPWYRFSSYPNQYEAWWGMPTLPNVEETDPGYQDYIIHAPDSVVAKWLSLGADGFRLDVVDELPDSFVLRLKQRLRQLKPDALLIGEVWEDASNKRAYGELRRYFTDGELDSTMNYPWRTAIIRYVLGEDDGSEFAERVMTIAENYPPQVLPCLMNHLGTHDTPRILTVLSGCSSVPKEAQADYRLPPEARKRGLERLEMAAFLQFTLPGMPSIYYGDEAGMEGFDDPYCRCCYPWGQEDVSLRRYFQSLCRLKTQHPALKLGEIRILEGGQGRVSYVRSSPEEDLLVCVNRGEGEWPIEGDGALCFGKGLRYDGTGYVLQPEGFCLLRKRGTAV